MTTAERTAAGDAPDVATWLGSQLARRFDDWVAAEVRTEVVTLAGALADDAAVLREHHDRLVDGGVPAPAAATYLVEWWAGIVAGAVGEALATTGAGLVVDGIEAPTDIRFHVHPDGWPCRVELPGRAVVTAGHPWAGTRGTSVLDDRRAVVERAVAGLVAVAAPIVDACHGLARVGRTGLWNEVGDALGTAVAHQQRFTVTPEMVEVLEAAVRAPGAPWRTRPDLVLVEAPAGTAHVVRKGGCCLAYTEQRPARDADDPSLDDSLRAYLRCFPDDPDGPRYCTTCSFRTLPDTTARQLFWHERRAAAD
ncbi:MAG: hypothetical protein ACLGIC_07190 [Acidimicrobiia bacterium]